MHIRTGVVAVAAIGSVLIGTTAAMAAPTTGTVPWSARYRTATASGERWLEGNGSVASRDLVVSGTLSHAGDGCHSLWTRFTFDFVPAPARKQAEVCGRASVDVAVRQAYRATTTGYLTVCKGTKDTDACSPWQPITSWPISSPGAGAAGSRPFLRTTTVLHGATQTIPKTTK